MGMREPGAPDGDGFIHDPRDADVLCGRGGAALRHPGNQTYRRLVSLNKGLYVTCLKTEKLKISRSIVAAIREQKGRFLEKDNVRNAWFDIGEKKAVEKTSQALREGAPKLRQKMAELQQHKDHHDKHEIFAQQTQDMLAQEQVMQQQQEIYLRRQELIRQHSLSSNLSAHSAGSNVDFPTTGALSPAATAVNSTNRHMDFQADMLQRLSLHEIGMQQKLAAAQREARAPAATSAPNPTLQQQQERSNRVRSSLNARSSLAKELGITESQLSLMTEYSAFGSSIGGRGSLTLPNSGSDVLQGSLGGGGNYQGNSGHMPLNQSFKRNSASTSMRNLSTSMRNLSTSQEVSMEPPARQQPAPPPYRFEPTSVPVTTNPAATATATAVAVNSSDIDRRRAFAKMKYNRPPSVKCPQNGGSQRSFDDLPDFNMLESNLSLYSLTSMNTINTMNTMNTANTTNTMNTAPDSKPSASEQHPRRQHHRPSPTNLKKESSFDRGYHPAVSQEPIKKVVVETAKVVDHSYSSRNNVFGDVLNGGSRHSIMSGLSKISDGSIDNSIFSDLSRKIGNVSTRSIAMSEMSCIDMQDMESAEVVGNIGDLGSPAIEGGPFEARPMSQPSLDFDL